MSEAATEPVHGLQVASSRVLASGAKLCVLETQRSREIQVVSEREDGAIVPLTPPIPLHAAAALRDVLTDALRDAGFPLGRLAPEYVATGYDRTFQDATPTDAAVAAVFRAVGLAINTSDKKFLGGLAADCIDFVGDQSRDSRGAGEKLVRQRGRRNFAAARLVALAREIRTSDATKAASAAWALIRQEDAELQSRGSGIDWPPTYATYHVLLAERLIDFLVEIMPSRFPAPVIESRKWAVMLLAKRLRERAPSDEHLLAIAALDAIGLSPKEAATFSASAVPRTNRRHTFRRK